MAEIWQQAYGYTRGGLKQVVEDRPLVQQLSDGSVRLQLSGRDATWTVELTLDECEHIAEAIGREAPGSRPAT